ncbi:hypothetical protein NLJ89_g5451 [Agrocybe chaxingu]|uniref:Uncharacterized protein n=1 Tax=Agrocybe chaxingu TaxID=84603 RepID=A0A9W8K791_9AGAR|nr:hypothetical protein NLJ89_g5451 [Agrocybe chaxingu]
MSSCPDALIDPELLAESDPATALLHSTPTQSSWDVTENLTRPGTPIDNDDETPATNTSHQDYSNFSFSTAPGMRTLIAFGRLVKQRKKLTDEAETEFDLYCQTEDVEERMALQFVLMLETRDLMKEIQKEDSERWSVSEDLKKDISRYVHTFMLSSSVTSYKGNAPEVILKMMREHKVNDLPSEKRRRETSDILSTIGKTLTQCRNVTKAKIIASLDREKKGADEGIRNIADLTAAIIGTTDVNPTLQLYMRVAFLRWIAINYPKVEDKYWDRVDLVLFQYRTSGKTALELTGTFNKMYRDDIAMFGNPADTHHKVTAPKDVADWLLNVDRFAATVVADIAPPQGKKRKRTGPN